MFDDALNIRDSEVIHNELWKQAHNALLYGMRCIRDDLFLAASNDTHRVLSELVRTREEKARFVLHVAIGDDRPHVPIGETNLGGRSVSFVCV